MPNSDATRAYNNYGLLVWSGTNQLASRIIPSFTLYPTNNDRTAWQDFGYPLVLTIPGRRSPNGVEIAGTDPKSLIIKVLDAPDRPYVNGHDHVGLRFPEEILYTRTVDLIELLSLKIDVTAQTFYDAAGNQKVYEDAVDGDRMLLTLESGVFDYIVWHQDVDYFDLSGLVFQTELLPNGYYIIDYTLNYQHRILTRDETSVVCITDDIVPSTCRIPFNHPGDVLADFINGLPAPNLTGPNMKQEPMVKLLRPLTDILQDVFDEQWFLQSINWVRDIQFPLVPYLVPLLGWDIPFFPKSADDLRRAVLLSLVEIQKTRGSIAAINRLFNLFGFTILVNNLYYLPNTEVFTGNNVIGPGEYPGFELENDGVVDLLLVGANTAGFGEVTIPLIYRPQSLDGVDPFKASTDSGSVTIHSFIVQVGSTAENLIKDYISGSGTPGPIIGSDNITDSSGFATTEALIDIERSTVDDGLISNSVVRLVNGTVVQHMISGDGGPIGTNNIVFNVEKNTISLTYDRYYDFENNVAIYSLAVYNRIKVIIPSDLTNMRSNYFDVQILSKVDNLLPTDSSILTFLLDFIYRVKAAHSLLRAFRYLSTFEETYLVGDFCVGYDVTQRFDVDAGVQQVPPAVIPHAPIGSCVDNPTELVGFKDTDYAYRKSVLAGTQAEYEAYNALSGRASTSHSYLKLPTSAPDSCGYLKYGQNLVLTNSRTDDSDLDVVPGIGANSLSAGAHPANVVPPNDVDHINTLVVGKIDIPDKFIVAEAIKDTSTYEFICSPSFTHDWCYKGRVDDTFSMTIKAAFEEQYDVGSHTCRNVTLGNGTFWYFDGPSNRYSRTGMNMMVCTDNIINRNLTFSGGKLRFGESLFPDFGVNSTAGIKSKINSWLGRILAGLDKNVILCYTNRQGLEDVRPESNLALTPASLNITVPILHFPTCRFVKMGNLTLDFTSSTYKSKPWDQTGCNINPDYLNPELVDGSDGDQQLVFDDAPYAVAGNGLLPDVTDMAGNMSGTASAADIWHAIYSYGNARHYDDSDVIFSSDQYILTDEPLFDTAVYDSSSGLFRDNIDGYPSDVGSFSFFPPGYRGRDELLSALGMPTPDIGTPISGLFKLGSGIHVGNFDGTDGTWNTSKSSRRPYGLRLNCEVAEDEYGGESFSSESVLELDEVFNSPWKMDGSIPSMLNIGVVG